MARAQIMAMNMEGFWVGLCWNILNLRQRVASRLLYFPMVSQRGIWGNSNMFKTYPHCMTTKVKKYTVFDSFNAMVSIE